MIDKEDPFAGVSFDSPTPSVSADDLTTILKSFGPSDTAFTSVASGGQAGIDRVNKNSTETGAVAYKDSKGQTVLTNVARNPLTNKEEKIGAGAPASPSSNIPTVKAPLALTNILDNLSKVSDAGAARGLFATFQEAAAVEQIRIESEAIAHAQTKLGVPDLQKKLAEAEAADKADPAWYPGIGDSPITMKMRTELDQARGYADQESKRFLGTNLSYKMLGNQVKQAEAEMVRIQRKLDRAENVEDNIKIRNSEREAFKRNEEAEAAEGITSTTLARIQVLNGTDFVEETNPQTRAFKILKTNKNPDFVKAVQAEGAELPMLAIKGNPFAKRLVISEEATNTGMPVAQVEAQLAKVQEILAKPKLLGKAFEKQLGEIQTQLTLSSGDPARKQQLGDERIKLAMSAIALQKTANYLGDTGSWDSIDPAFRAAMDKAAKTTGKRTMEDTLAAYLGDSTGPEYLQKLAEFDKIARMAAQKHEKSMFGMPDYRVAGKLIATYAVEKGTFRKFLEQTGKIKFSLPELGNDTIRSGQAGMLPAALDMFGRTVQGMGQPDVSVINPATGKPFGE